MKLVGYIDGVEVSFDFYPPNQFKADIPKNMNGVYVIELHATDDAGNVTSKCDVSVLIDFDKLAFKVLDSDILFKTYSDEFEVKSINNEFNFKESVMKFEFETLQQEFISKELI